MENEYNEDIDSTNDIEEVVEETEEEYSEPEGEDLEAEVKKATAPLYARMKQAEQEAKELKAKLASKSDKPEVKKTGELDTKDVIYLAKADIHDEDLEEVLNHAKMYNLSVRDAHSYLNPILAARAEQRKTAEAANVGSSRRGSGGISDETLLSKASKGEVPTNDADIERLIEARFQSKKSK